MVGSGSPLLGEGRDGRKTAQVQRFYVHLPREARSVRATPPVLKHELGVCCGFERKGLLVFFSALWTRLRLCSEDEILVLDEFSLPGSRPGQLRPSYKPEASGTYTSPSCYHEQPVIKLLRAIRAGADRTLGALYLCRRK